MSCPHWITFSDSLPVSTAMTWLNPVPKPLFCRMRNTQLRNFCAANVPSQVERGLRQLSHVPQLGCGYTSPKYPSNEARRHSELSA